MKARLLIVGEYMACTPSAQGSGFWMMVEAAPK